MELFPSGELSKISTLLFQGGWIKWIDYLSVKISYILAEFKGKDNFRPETFVTTCQTNVGLSEFEFLIPQDKKYGSRSALSEPVV